MALVSANLGDRGATDAGASTARPLIARPSTDGRSAEGPSTLRRVISGMVAAISSARMMWVLMLVMHGLAIPSLITTTGSAHSLADLLGPMIRLAGLTASAAFFVLKIIDVPCLRLNSDWRSIVCIVLIIGLMHVGVIDRALGGDLTTEGAHIGYVILAGLTRWRAAVIWAMCLLLSRLWLIRLLRFRPHKPLFGTGLSLTRADEIIARISQTFLPWYSGPRAPPIC